MKTELAKDEKRGKRSLVILIVTAAISYVAGLLGVPDPWPLLFFVAINVAVNIKI